MPDDRQRVVIPFGQGLGRHEGSLLVNPSSIADLRNAVPLDGKVTTRPGFEIRGTLPASGFGEITHILAGQALRTERLGIVVGWSAVTRWAQVFRTQPDGSDAEFLGSWFVSEDDEPPIVRMAESFGRVFIAHDHALVTERAPTLVYGPLFGTRLQDLRADLGDGAGEQDVKFRGVVQHLEYLFGWGFGVHTEDRPEMVRSSLPGQPATFDPNHYFVVGDRRVPVLNCEPAETDLVVLKSGEQWQIFGYDRSTFGQRRRDPRHGIIGSRLAVSVGGLVYFWSHDGPRVTDGASPSDSIELPMALRGFQPQDLVEASSARNAFAVYLSTERTILFVFGRRAYALTAHNPSAPKWGYWELGFEPLTAFTLFDTDPDLVQGLTGAYPEWEGETAAGSFVDIDVRNHGQFGDEILEVWLRAQGSTDPEEWFLALSKVVSPQETEVVRVEGLTEGACYDGALRYRRGLLIEDAFTGDPATWPEIAQGSFCQSLDPAELGTFSSELGQRLADPGAGQWIWERTSASSQYVQFRVRPGSDELDHRIEIERAQVGGSFSQIADLVEGVDFNLNDLDASGRFLFRDTDPPQGEALLYRARTVVGANSSPWSSLLQIWPGPMPQGQFAGGRVPRTHDAFFEENRQRYTFRATAHSIQPQGAGTGASVMRHFDNWNDSSETFESTPNQDRGPGPEFFFDASPEDQGPPEWGANNLAARKTVEFSNPLPAGQQITLAFRYEATRFGVTDFSELYLFFVAY